MSFKVQLDVQEWTWKPIYIRSCGGLHWLCFLTWTNWLYEDHFRKRGE